MPPALCLGSLVPRQKSQKCNTFNVCINYGSMMSTKLMKRYFINPLHALYSSTSGQLTCCPCSRVPLQVDLRTHWPTKRDENTHSWQHGRYTCLKQGWLTYTHVSMECASSHPPSSEWNTQYNGGSHSILTWEYVNQYRALFPYYHEKHTHPWLTVISVWEVTDG